MEELASGTSPPDAERGPGGGLVQVESVTNVSDTTKSAAGATPDGDLLLVLGRHRRMSCILRSHQTTPCRRCCWCVGPCGCPEFAPVLVVSR